MDDNGVPKERRTFGGRGRYYDLSEPEKRREPRFPTPEWVPGFLNQHDPDLRRRVERAFKQWNQVLRDYLRTETALRLTVGDDARAVPVKIVPGLPRPFADAIDGDEPELWRLMLRRSHLESARLGLRVVQEDFEWISSWDQVLPAPATQDEIEHSLELVEKIVKALGKLRLVEKIRSIDQDVLGAYLFGGQNSEIHLYWMVIGLMAGVLGVAPEALTVVVAAHELTHAYTHLGRDIDGERWDTRRFAAAEIDIAEGLAQFYTAVMCEKLESRYPAALDAYGKLLEMQSGPYLAHVEWREDGLRVGEVVRAAMINTRSRGIAKYDEFRAELEQVLERLTAGDGKKQGTT